MIKNRYEYKYDDKFGYYLKPDNIEIIQIMPQNIEDEGLSKVCLKNKKIYLFFAKKVDYKDENNRSIGMNYDIYEISDFNNLDEIIKEFNIEPYLSKESKKNLIKTISNWNHFNSNKITFDEDYFPFIILNFLNLNRDKVCFEKEKFIGNIKLNKFEEKLFNNFNEILLKEYFEYLTEKKLGKNIKNYLNKQEIKEVLEILEDCKKDIYLKAEKWGLLDVVIPTLYEYECKELQKELLLNYIEKIADEKEIEVLFNKISSLSYNFMKNIKSIF